MYFARRGRNLPATDMGTNQDAGARVKDSRPTGILITAEHAESAEENHY
jgi:hypothetical protein